MERSIHNRCFQISFIRTAVGHEFDVAKRIAQRCINKQGLFYYTCLGYYDLVEFLTLEDIQGENLYPLDNEILEVSSIRCFLWASDQISKVPSQWIGRSPILLLVMLRLHPFLVLKLGLDAEIAVTNYLTDLYKNTSNIFIGLGRSEILLLLKGKNLQSLLSEVPTLRKQMRCNNVLSSFKETFPNETSDLPIFCSTTTFPLLLHPRFSEVSEASKYEEFEGLVNPLITISCDPSYELDVIALQPKSAKYIRNLYGKDDLIIRWENPLPLKDFMKELTQLRDDWKKKKEVYDTSTILQGSEDLKETKTVPSRNIKLKSVSLLEEDVSWLNESQISPFLRMQLQDFIGRLNTCYLSQHITPYFRDMLNMKGYIKHLVSELSDETHPSAKAEVEMDIAQLIDLGNHGIYQRYSGIESHLETTSYLPFPLLCDINGVISAASSIPWFIHENIFEDHSATDTWSGFVVFGQTYSYEWLLGGIYSYPARTLFQPITEWWGITHEVCHDLFNIFEVEEKISKIAQKLADYIGEIRQKSRIDLNFDYFLQEIFANWFDYKFIFTVDKKELFFQNIWESWINIPRVWEESHLYILRTLALYSCSDLVTLRRTLSDSKHALHSLLNQKLEELKKIISQRVPTIREIFEESGKEKTHEDIYECLERLLPYLVFLEEQFFKEELFKRLNPEYPLLSTHIEKISNGAVVTDNIVNPIALLHGLQIFHLNNNKSPSIGSSIALVLSLWNWLLKSQPVEWVVV